MSIHYFNSIKVQLEPKVLVMLHLVILNFNSIKVQLERASAMAAARYLDISIP